MINSNGSGNLALCEGGERVSSNNVELVCARDECNETFIQKKHNQKYHDDECCRLATNKKVMEKYHERRARKLGKTRMCSSCKETKLSRYNDSTVCAACQAKSVAETNESVLDMLTRAIA